MNYNKPPLTFEQQADRLISRGLIVNDRKELIDYLSQVNYYRLSGYWYIFKNKKNNSRSEMFRPNTTFEMIKDRYEFDRKLRLLLMDAVERIEVAILRTRLVEINTSHYGPFGYTDVRNYNPKFSSYKFQNLMARISDDENRSHEEFIHRYRAKYTSEDYLPLWMVTDLMSFGELLTLYKNQHLKIKQEISYQFNLKPPVLDSWLLTMNTVRNSCAHHSRFWNRPLSNPVTFPPQKYDSRWHLPQKMPPNKVFTIMTIIHYLLDFILPVNTWKTSVNTLFSEYPGIPIIPMGFPEDWENSSLWQ